MALTVVFMAQALWSVSQDMGSQLVELWGGWGGAAHSEGDWALKLLTVMVNCLATCQGFPIDWIWLSTSHCMCRQGNL